MQLPEVAVMAWKPIAAMHDSPQQLSLPEAHGSRPDNPCDIGGIIADLDQH